jgi:hypothetical protein
VPLHLLLDDVEDVLHECRLLWPLRSETLRTRFVSQGLQFRQRVPGALIALEPHYWVNEKPDDRA